MANVVFRGTRREARAIAGRLAGLLSGRLPDEASVGIGYRSAIGFAALADIKEAFIVKARGGMDEMGVKWAPLKPQTIANRRVGGRATAAAQERKRIQRRETKKALRRFRMSLPEPEAQRRARIVGGLKATQETGKTKVKTLGNRDVEILRDTSAMFNSLSPGELAGAEYSKPAEEGGENQIFDVLDGDVIVGSNDRKLSKHQNGDPSKNLPARPVLPDDDHPVPGVWWERWLRVANQALVLAVARLYSQS